MYNDWLSIGNFTIHGYGVMIALGFVAALLLSYYRAKKNGLEQEAIVDLALLCIVAGFAGAKLLYIIVEWKTFIKEPLSVIGGAGFVVYGGVVCGILVGGIYCYFKKLKFLAYLNLIIPQIALAQGIGRIGCFFAGCCYGAPTDSFLGIVFPQGSIAPAGIRLWPTQLFMAAGDLAIAGILYLFGRNDKLKKHVAEAYMLLYGIGRFAIEFLRNDSRGNVGMLSTSQFISIFIVAGGIAILVFRYIKSKKNA